MTTWLRKPFASTLNYSACNEDWQSELTALQLNPTDEVLCITASGDRTLHTLLGNPARVVSIDANPLQNQLYQLKAAAIRFLNYDDFTAFIGLVPSDNRLRVFDSLRGRSKGISGPDFHLSLAAIESGIVYEGRWEKYYRSMTKFPKYCRPGVFERLFEFEDLAQQRNYVETVWDRGWWRSVSVLSSHPFLSRHVFGDPGLSENVDPSIGQVGGYIYDRMKHIMTVKLARQNFMLSLLFRGEFRECPPAYLQERSFETLRARLDRVDVTTGDVLEYLKSQPDRVFSKFSFSDMASHLTKEQFHTLLEQMIRTAKPGARFCIRQFLSRYVVPERFRTFVKQDADVEAALRARDLSFVYDFTVGSISK
jgi:S-adenosylmethionine-diacylglycerol 3-amino-3-carboxypropyl transferase